MNYTKVLITGAGSYIASQCMPSLELGSADIFLQARKFFDPKKIFEHNKSKSIIIENLSGEDALKKLENSLDLRPEDNLLIINFIGSFGSMERINSLDIKKFESEINENLTPFMVLSKLVTKCKQGLFLSFTGAGVGGNNLEIASLSYLASKASIAVLIEGLDNFLRNDGIRVGAISPGPFPSKMQKMVAESHGESSVSVERRNQAIATMQTEIDATKLISMLNFLVANPELAGGRIWSANFDPHLKDLEKENFGKMRRVF